MNGVLISIVKFIHEAGLLGILVLVLVGGWRRWWVFGSQHDRIVARYEQALKERTAERDDWKRLVLLQTEPDAKPD
jgi:hypothetical protein